MSPVLIVLIVVTYFSLLFLISYITGKDSNNESFFIGEKKSPWYLVAFGMIGASLSGVTFISVPGWVADSHFSYMAMVFGYLIGYLVIATVLMPMYYRLNLTSIYGYLDDRFGRYTYRTGAGFFILSRTIGAAFRLYLVAIVLQKFIFDAWNIPFWVTVMITIILIWLYTFRGGIKTIVWTDSLQTFLMLLSLGLSIWYIGSELGLSLGGVIDKVRGSDLSQIFFFENGYSDSKNFFKRFFGGALIALVMTGLDQDMMQKNLSCKTIGEAQKNMFWFSVVLVIANFVFMSLGLLLYHYIPFADRTDYLFPVAAMHYLPDGISVIFLIGLLAAAYSSADSALTSLTTSFCVDFLGFKEGETNQNTRIKVHLGFSVLLFAVLIVFNYIIDKAVISEIFTWATFTYGPLLGLYAFGMLTKRRYKDGWPVILICILAPLLCLFIRANSQAWFGYVFSFELLALNGLLTFLGLLLLSLFTKPSHVDLGA